jgi:hypothetical protein
MKKVRGHLLRIGAAKNIHTDASVQFSAQRKADR